jgi:TolA-binding protein
VIQNYKDREIAAQAQYFVGQCYQGLEDLETAVRSYLTVINDYPDVTSVDEQKLSIGIFFEDIKMFDLALKAYMQVAKMTEDPEIKLEAQFYIGDASYKSGEYQQAILEFLKVTFMGFSPKNIWVATARERIGQIYETRGDWQKALEMYQGLYDDFGGGDPRGQKAKQRMDEIRKKINE